MEIAEQLNKRSKLEYMAQKQNRVAQHVLNAKICEIDKAMAVARVSHRLFIKQLKLVNPDALHCQNIFIYHYISLKYIIIFLTRFQYHGQGGSVGKIAEVQYTHEVCPITSKPRTLIFQRSFGIPK